MAAMIGKIDIPIEAKVMIRVGEHNVPLDELAAALHRAGLEMLSLMTSATSNDDRSAPSVEALGPLLATLRPGTGFLCDHNGEIHALENGLVTYEANAWPKVTAIVRGRFGEPEGS